MYSDGNTGRPLKIIGRVSSSSGFLSSANKMSSSHCLAGQTGILDPMQLMSMQEDAHSRKISTEVMRRSLHNSLTTPCRRRYTRSRKPSSGFPREGRSFRYFQSLPVTPARASPSSSPTRMKTFGGSRDSEIMPFVDLQVEEDSWRGLASLFKPKPRYIGACFGSKTTLCGENDENFDLTNVVDLNRGDPSP